MFTPGKLIFAIFFVVTFTFVITLAYKKDKKLHLKNYKGVIWVLFTFIIFVIFLFLFKYLLKN